jgi:serine/threonine-protein kinase RsbW
MTQRPAIRVELISDPRLLAGVRELAASVAERLGFPDDACAQIKLAVDEALCNILRHGYDRRPDGPIWVSLWPLQDDEGVGLKIVIEDEARQVDPAQIKGRDLDEIRPGGLGVHIIRKVMDEATYEKRGKAGMRLTMIKRPGSTSVETPDPRPGCGRQER